MNGLNAFLMPSSFLRRWSYDELIPSLLYFDQITFLMDDIEPRYISDKPEYQQPPVRLRSPKELAGMNANDFVDGLLVEQHHYYWPMRDLMKAEVIAMSSADMYVDFEFSEHQQQLRDLLAQNNARAVEFETAASEYYDFMSKEPSTLSRFEKAIEVHGWINHALRFPREGWEQVTIHPYGYMALLSALELFPDLYQLSLRRQSDQSGSVGLHPAQSYLARSVVATLLREELDSFTLEGDPEALSEILEVRRKHASELQAFRVKMIEAAKEWEILDSDLRDVPARIESYVQTVRPVFEQTRRVFSDSLRIPKLVLRKGGALIMTGAAVGVGAFLGTIVAGPVGALAGAAVSTAAAEALKSFFEELGKKTASTIQPSGVSIDKSLAYMVYAQQALQKRHGR